MNERDPRMDPQHGDVLRGARIIRTVNYRSGCVVNYDSTPVGVRGRKYSGAIQLVTEWRKWARSAIVIALGEVAAG